MQVTRSRYSRAAIAAAVLASAVALVHAGTSAENEAATINDAKVSMAQAVTAAEQHAGGKAVRAEYEKTKTGWSYDVEVANGAKTFDVRIDSVSGAVLSSHEDKRDHEANDGDDERSEQGEQGERD